MDRSLSTTTAQAEQLLRNLAGQLPYFAAALVVLVLFYLASKIARLAVCRALRSHDQTLARMLASLTSAVIVALGILTALWIAIPTFKFTEIFASLGVTGLILGIALRDLIENFVAGMLILWRRPYHLGDQIRSGAHEGTVEEINFRSTVLRTYDGTRVYIPNGRVFTDPLENLTSHRKRRTTVVLAIDQTASVARAREVILAALPQVEGVLADPAPAVFFDTVGDYSNNLHVLYWTSPPTRFSELTTKSDVTERLFAALQDADVAFPYPIQTVRLVPMPTNGARAAERPPHGSPQG